MESKFFSSVDKDEWDKIDATPILPPLYEKYAGRRKKNRRKNPEESADGTRLSKHGVLQHCGYCRQRGHRRGSCKLQQAAIRRENEVAAAQDGAQQHPPQQDGAQQHHAEPYDDHEEHYQTQYAYYEESEEEEETAQPAQQHHSETHSKKIDKGKGPASTQEQAKENVSARGRKRKPTTKAKEQLEQLLHIAKRKKSKQIIDENGDIDFPIIRTVRNLSPHSPAF